MIPEYPNDADGDVLRRVASDGNDMTKPMEIDFVVAVPDESSARRFAAVVTDHGFEASIDQDDDQDGTWSVYCTKTMIASYEGVIAAQSELDELSAPVNGYCDGWGTFGNSG